MPSDQGDGDRCGFTLHSPLSTITSRHQWSRATGNSPPPLAPGRPASFRLIERVTLLQPGTNRKVASNCNSNYNSNCSSILCCSYRLVQLGDIQVNVAMIKAVSRIPVTEEWCKMSKMSKMSYNLFYVVESIGYSFSSQLARCRLQVALVELHSTLAAIYCQFSILPFVFSILHFTFCILCLVFSVECLELWILYFVFYICYWLLAACRLLLAALCLQSPVCCLLFAVCYLLFCVFCLPVTSYQFGEGKNILHSQWHSFTQVIPK